MVPSSPAISSLNNLKTLGNRRLYLSYSGDLPYLFLLYPAKNSLFGPPAERSLCSSDSFCLN